MGNDREEKKRKKQGEGASETKRMGWEMEGIIRPFLSGLNLGFSG